ncbi:MAG: hypothetical protein ACLGGX_08445 [Bdellovibrionia bacterium]
MKTILTMMIYVLSLKANAMDLGKYTYGPNDPAQTVLTVYPGNTVSVERVRQVGNDLTPEVPFPTFCRIREWTRVTEETDETLTVHIKIAELLDSTDLPKTEACGVYVRNGNELLGRVQFSEVIHKSSLQKIK